MNNCSVVNTFVPVGEKLVKSNYLEPQIFNFVRKKSTSLKITGVIDADFAKYEIVRKSCTGFAFFLGNGTISWKSKEQSNVVVSITSETEYVAISEACKVAKCLKNLLYEISNKEICIEIFNDNQSAQAWTNQQMSYNRTKHIVMKSHSV